TRSTYAGTYSNIVISVSDGTASASLTAFSIAVNQISNGSATVNWTPPTSNSDGSTLLSLRFVLALAVGADYPIASALLSEFAPKRQRGMLLAAMIGAWWLGYTISFIAGYALGNEGLSWRWMLAS